MSETEESSCYMDSEEEEEEAVDSSQEASSPDARPAEEPWRAFMSAFQAGELIFHIPGA
jgi:hypothetical protein